MEERPMTLDDCQEMVDDFWDEEAKEIFGTREAMINYMIVVFMSARLDLNLFDPKVRDALIGDDPTIMVKTVTQLME